jgi:hypothetical protein
MHSNIISDSKVQIVHEEIIDVAATTVFPLACPVLEYKWIPGWKCELIHCPAGHVESGTVFNEIMSAPVLIGRPFGKTTWTAVDYNPAQHRVHYALQNPVSVSLNKLEFDEMEPARTRFRMDLTYEAINEHGKKVIRNHGAEKIGFMQTMLATLLKHYCEQGVMMTAMEIKKMALRFNVFSIKDKYRLALNEVAMRLMRDNQRKKFFKGMPISVSSLPPVSG